MNARMRRRAGLGAAALLVVGCYSGVDEDAVGEDGSAGIESDQPSI